MTIQLNKDKHEKDKEFKYVFNQLDEYLSIMSKSNDKLKFEHVNKRFLNEFED